jgi:tRNA-modifying protein YgfZ
MNSPLKLSNLDTLGVLRARGADVIAFLQGQLSNDVSQLSAQHSLLAGYHNPQGRTIALLRLLEHAPQDVLAILPRELIGAVAARLSKFILRSKVKLTDESAHWLLQGISAAAPDPQLPTSVSLPGAVNEVAQHAAALIVRVGATARWLLVQPADAAAVLSGMAAAPAALWHAGAIAAAEPQVFAATSEEFVAQMLNLDVLGAIAFDKGCYTGQEVIARAHYRGRVKRRLQRFITAAAVALKPGDSAALADGRSVKIVDAVQHLDGRCEFLGVTGVAAGEPEPPATDPAPQAAGSAAIEAQPLPMPYALPR